MLLQGKVSIITGGAGGIGLACAKRFLQEGARVVLADLDQSKGRQALDGLQAGAEAIFVPCDVSREEQVVSLVERALQSFGRVDIAVANAGIVHSCDPLELREQDLDRVLSINLKGVVFLGQQAAKAMLQQDPDPHGERGSIINVSSVNGVMTIPEISAYCMSKGAVNQWTKAFGISLASRGVRVNGVGPGSINTEMFQSVAENPQKLARVMSRTPMQRAGEPDEIAKAAAFLASHYASYMTGQTIYPDGGRLGLNYTV